MAEMLTGAHYRMLGVRYVPDLDADGEPEKSIVKKMKLRLPWNRWRPMFGVGFLNYISLRHHNPLLDCVRIYWDSLVDAMGAEHLEDEERDALNMCVDMDALAPARPLLSSHPCFAPWLQVRHGF